MSAPLKLGISSCLLGDTVRWDGSHERLALLADVLGAHVDWVRMCPEVEAGLGVPREPIAFVRRDDGLVLLGARSREDVGPRLAEAASRILGRAGGAGLDGWVLTSRSPSCGLDGARVYATAETLAADGEFERAARGVFADALLRAHPELPVVDDVTLGDAAGLEHFVERCYAMRRVRASLGSGRAGGPGVAAPDTGGPQDDAPGPAALADIHERHELQVLARSAEARNELAVIAERAGDDAEAAGRWVEAFARAMAIPPTVERTAGALRRAAMRLRRRAWPGQEEVDWSIGAFATGAAPLDDVIDRVREAAARAGDDLLLRQTLLVPDPGERALRLSIRVATGSCGG